MTKEPPTVPPIIAAIGGGEDAWVDRTVVDVGWDIT